VRWAERIAATVIVLCALALYQSWRAGFGLWHLRFAADAANDAAIRAALILPAVAVGALVRLRRTVWRRLLLYVLVPITALFALSLAAWDTTAGHYGERATRVFESQVSPGEEVAATASLNRVEVYRRRPLLPGVVGARRVAHVFCPRPEIIGVTQRGGDEYVQFRDRRGTHAASSPQD
jgi:hypothetical protein